MHPKRMSRVTCASLIVTIAIASTASAQMKSMGHDKNSTEMSKMEHTMADWPMASREAVAFMTKKYGAPVAMTADMAVWGKTGPWKRTVVYRAEYAHEFPMHHTDVMQQWIDYKAPAADKFGELAMYDGSVVVERTAGEMSARCDKEGANFLALNLADEIIAGKRSVADARKMYGEQIMAMKAMQPAPYTMKLLFNVPMGGTGDPDHAVAADHASNRPTNRP
ncbi:MAG TPA: hypothetical protein VHE78_00335 [Gemmatimonadaceae bacterium]|nr:hypothetical protein [Gemmatimonadaceae bacterium]